MTYLRTFLKHRIFCGSGVAVGTLVLVLGSASRASAQAMDDARNEGANSPSPAAEAENPAPAANTDHMFGVLANYTTVERGQKVTPLNPARLFELTAKNTFDGYVFPFVGAVAAMDGGGEDYAGRYAIAMADNAIGNFMTSAVFPTVLKQDSRYFESGNGSVVRRAAYAASRAVVTRNRAGRGEFNLSEIGGNAVAAGLSNLYYEPAERTVTGTLTRCGMQVLFDSVSNELKEFWPDVRRRISRK